MVLILTAKKEIDFNRINFSLAGSGDPWSSLTRTRVRILKELHDNLELNEVANALDLTLGDLNKEIECLRTASLVFETNGQYKPSFLIANESEAQLAHKHASAFSKNLAITVEENLENMKESFGQLNLSHEYSFENLAFLFVGGRIIDIKMLEKLSTDLCIMPPAPSRPSPGRPDAQYYFWMIEGEKKYLGEYGLDDYTLPWSDWYYYSFGQNLIDGKPNPGRKQMELRYLELVESGTIQSPESLAQNLKIPFVSEVDSKRWSVTSDEQANILSLHFQEHEQSIKELHTLFNSSQYAPHSLGEFICWYAHIAYSVVIDILESKRILPIPEERYQSAIWFRKQEQEGILIKR